MQFIHQENFTDPFFKDIIRIDYDFITKNQLISDFGYSYLMLKYGKMNTWDHQRNSIHIPDVFIKTTGDFFYVDAYPGSSWITFELPATFFHKVTNLNASKYINKLLDLKEFIEPEVVDKLYKQLADSHEIGEILTITHKMLSSKYDGWSEILRADKVLDYIYEMNGLITNQELIDQFPYSQRTMERFFQECVGISPYRYIRLIRFNFIIREIEKGESLLPDLIQKYNYYDQSHFEKDFKKFLGQSIATYKNEFNPLLTQALARNYIS